MTCIMAVKWWLLLLFDNYPLNVGRQLVIFSSTIVTNTFSRVSIHSNNTSSIPSCLVRKLTTSLRGPWWALFNTITAALTAVYGHSRSVRPRTTFTSLFCRARELTDSFSGHRLTDRRIRSSVTTMSGCSVFQNCIFSRHRQMLLGCNYYSD